MKPYFAASLDVGQLDDELAKSVGLVKALSKSFREEHAVARDLDADIRAVIEAERGDDQAPPPAAPGPSPAPLLPAIYQAPKAKMKTPREVRAKKPAAPKVPARRAPSTLPARQPKAPVQGQSKAARIKVILSEMVDQKTRQRNAPVKPMAQRYVERFLALVEKPILKKQAITLLVSLKKAIEERRIRKGNALENHIMAIQQTLINVYESPHKPSDKLTIEVDKGTLAALVAATKRYTVYPSLQLVKKYLTWLGKPEQAKAKALVKEMGNHLAQKAKKDPYNPVLEVISRNMNQYLSDGNMPQLQEATLRGLDGLGDLSGLDGGTAGPYVDALPEHGLVSLGDFMNTPDRPRLRMNEVAALLGAPFKNMHIAVGGVPGQGKSTLCHVIAKDLSEHGNVLYLAGEEYDQRDTFKEKARRTGLATRMNVQVAGQFQQAAKWIKDEDDFLKYLADSQISFLIVDSVQTSKLSDHFVMKCKKRCPNMGVVFVFQSTKAGKARGSQTWLHDVDAVVNVAKGRAETTKNRAGSLSEMKVPYMNYEPVRKGK